MKKLILSLTVLYTAFGGIAKASEPKEFNEPIVWKIQSHKDSAAFIHKNFMKYIVNPVNAELEGEFKFELYSQNKTDAIRTNEETFSALLHGQIDGMFMAPLYWGNIDPIFPIVGDLTAAWKTPNDFITWFDTSGEKFIQQAYRKFGMEMVGYTLSPHESMISTKPLNNIESLKGMIIRAPAGSMAKDYFIAAGAIPRAMSMGKARDALKSKRIDMADYSTIGSNFKEGLYDSAKHTNYPGFHSLAILDFVVNKEEWEKLPKSVRFVIKKHATDWKINNIKDMQALNDAALPKLKDHGVIVHKWSDEELIKARALAVNVWDDYAKRSPEANDAIQSIKKWLKENNQL